MKKNMQPGRMNVEYINDVLDLLSQVTVTKDMLRRTQVDKALEDLQEKLTRTETNPPASGTDTNPVDEQISKKSFKLLSKWKTEIEELRKDVDAMMPRKRFKDQGVDEVGQGRGDGDKMSDEHGSRSYRSRAHREGDRSNSPRERRLSRSSRGAHDSRISSHDRSGRHRRRRIRWEDDGALVKVKYFKFGDEPNAAGLTEAEVEAIQKKLAEEMGAGRGMASEDYKHKESRWEAQSMKNVTLHIPHRLNLL